MHVLAYDPKFQEVWKTPCAEKIIARACRASTNGGAQYTQVIDRIMRAEHTSVLEHVVICFELFDISRSCFDQLARHRMASITAQSTRYVNLSEARFWVEEPAFQRDSIECAVRAYDRCVERGMELGEARQVLPLSVDTRCLWTINCRSLLNFFKQRLCGRASKEINLLAHKLHKHCTAWLPEIFVYAYPACTDRAGSCPEGSHSCGKVYSINEH